MADGADIDLYSDDIDQGFGPIKVNAIQLFFDAVRVRTHCGRAFIDLYLCYVCNLLLFLVGRLCR